jgi:hypothetical protein
VGLRPHLFFPTISGNKQRPESRALNHFIKGQLRHAFHYESACRIARAGVSVDAATARHLREQKLDLARRKRLEAAERAREKINNPNGTLHRIRIGDLNKIFGECYGTEAIDYQFPDDDAGRIDAMILARHYANGNPNALARAVRHRLPWMAEAERQSLIEEALESPRFWGAEELAHDLQLTDKRRTELKIKSIGSIDMTKRQRNKRRKAKNTEQHRAADRAKGVKPREQYLAEHTTNRDKPWEAEGISRRTHFRRLAQAKTDGMGTGGTSPSAVKLLSVTEEPPVPLETSASAMKLERAESPKTWQEMNMKEAA